MEQPDGTVDRESGAKAPMALCAHCGFPFAPQRQVERLRKKLAEKAVLMDACLACRRRLQAAAAFAAYDRLAAEQEVPDVP